MANLIGSNQVDELSAIKSALQRICGLHDTKNGDMWSAIADAKALLMALYPEPPSYDKKEMEWRTVEGFEDYEVSNYGDMRRRVANKNNRFHAGTPLNPKICNNGYHQVSLSSAGKVSFKNVHRVVALAFLPPPEKEWFVVAHLDGNKLNNYAGNLKWASNSVNQLHRRFHRGSGALSETQAKQVISQAMSGETCAKLAKDHGVSHGVINKIVNQVTYAGGR